MVASRSVPGEGWCGTVIGWGRPVTVPRSVPRSGIDGRSEGLASVQDGLDLLVGGIEQGVDVGVLVGQHGLDDGVEGRI
jgi:hypothetical protein